PRQNAPALTLRTCGVMPAKGATSEVGEAPLKEPFAIDDQERPAHVGGGVLVDAVSRTFQSRRGPVEALRGMSLRADPDEVVAVVGPSGCGKTTVLELICGLQEPDE